MAHLRTEIEKIFNEIDKDLQNNKENSMTIYDCFDFQEEEVAVRHEQSVKSPMPNILERTKNRLFQKTK